jgi:hypothetical protein
LLSLEVKNQQSRHQKEENKNDGDRKIVHHKALVAPPTGRALQC